MRLVPHDAPAPLARVVPYGAYDLAPPRVGEVTASTVPNRPDVARGGRCSLCSCEEEREAVRLIHRWSRNAWVVAAVS